MSQTTPMEVEYPTPVGLTFGSPIFVPPTPTSKSRGRSMVRDRERDRPYGYGSKEAYRTPPPTPKMDVEDEIENINRRISGVVDILITLGNDQRTMTARIDSLQADLERLRLY